MAEFRIYFETKHDVTVEMIEQTGATKVMLVDEDEFNEGYDYIYVATVTSQKMIDDIAKLSTTKPEPEAINTIRMILGAQDHTKTLEELKQIKELYEPVSPFTISDEHRNDIFQFQAMLDESEKSSKRQKIEESSNSESESEESSDSGSESSESSESEKSSNSESDEESEENSNSDEETGSDAESSESESDESVVSSESAVSEEDYDIFQTMFKTIKNIKNIFK